MSCIYQHPFDFFFILLENLCCHMDTLGEYMYKILKFIWFLFQDQTLELE